LIKRCRKSLTAFVKKGISLVIKFDGNKWGFDGDENDPAIQKLLETCTKHFDEFAESGVVVEFTFDEKFRWTISTEKKGDLPDIATDAM
jgi:hypothetical protein